MARSRDIVWPSAYRPRGALLLPLRVAPLQQILGAGTAQMRAAILHHHLAIDIARGIRNQKTREIGELAMVAGAAERIPLRPAFVTALGAKLTARAGGRKWGRPRRDRTDSPWGALHHP